MARLARYTPECLPAGQWALVGGTVKAAVLAAEPVDAEDAKGLVSRLCLFLAGPCGWDRSSVPDLVALLGRDGIDAHLDRLAIAGKKPKTAENHRADLARVARGLAGMAGRRVRAQEAPPAISALAATLAGFPGSFAAAAAAWEELTGGPLRRDDLEPVSGLVEGPGSAACAFPGAPGTFSRLSGLASAPDTPTTAEELAATTPPKSADAPSRTRPMSRAAALRHARASKAAAEAATTGPILAAPPDPSALAAGVAAAIAAFTPNDLSGERWNQLRPVWERLIVGYAAPKAASVGNPASILAGFCDWACSRPGRPDPAGPLAAEELLGFGLIDAYDTHLAEIGVPDGSRATRRSVVRRALRALDTRPTSAKIAYQPVAGPYSPAECAGLVRLARHQPTASRRSELSFVVGLGLGAGLDGRDMRHVARSGFTDIDLDEATLGLAVTVAGGERPRTVVIRRAYEPLVREALRLHDAARRGRTAPVIGRSATRRNITNPVMAHAVTARAGATVDIEVNRLRATWLVAAMCAPVPLATLLQTAGLRSVRTLTDLLTHCPDPDPATVAAALAHLGQSGFGQGQGRS